MATPHALGGERVEEQNCIALVASPCEGKRDQRDLTLRNF